jgi:hypothetical protein
LVKRQVGGYALFPHDQISRNALASGSRTAG